MKKPTTQNVDFCHDGVDRIVVISLIVLFTSDFPMVSLNPITNRLHSFSMSSLEKRKLNLNKLFISLSIIQKQQQLFVSLDELCVS